MKKILIFIIAGMALTTTLQAEETNSATNKEVRTIEELTATCVACHGDTGISPTAANPNLAGQYRDYLLISMKRYQTGERKNAVMTGLVAGMTEKELERLAVFYSRQEGLWDTATPRFK